jgi:hypothetical protein
LAALAGSLWALAKLDLEAPNSAAETPAPAAFLKNARLFIILPLLTVSSFI